MLSRLQPKTTSTSSQRGPQGAQGIAGAQGNRGPTGPRGYIGPQGPGGDNFNMLATIYDQLELYYLNPTINDYVLNYTNGELYKYV